jgi:threonine 3-dehydrogenase
VRALRKLRPNPGLDLVEIPPPTPGPSDVVIGVRYAGICGTDRHIFEWDDWAANRVPLGITIGHELMGVVHEIGAGVTGVAPGDRVSAEGHIGCGTCRMCLTGRAHICERVDILGIDVDGALADFVTLPAGNVWKLSDGIDDRTGALMDPFGNAVHTVSAAGVSGRDVLVTGCGVIGLMVVAVARACGAASIIAVDLDPTRTEHAVRLGADHALDSADPSWPAAAKKLTNGEGPDVLLEISGAPTAIRGGVEALRNGGTAALLGLPSEPVLLDLPTHVIFKGATVLGVNGRVMFDTWFRADDLLVSGKVDLSSIVTHELTLDRADEAFDLLARREALKVLFRVSE